MFPTNPIENTEYDRMRYIKSHGNWEAGKAISFNLLGEQKNRQYQWPFDPN